MDERSKAFLDIYLSSLPTQNFDKYTSFCSDHFCNDEYNANLCADLILHGEKQASCSLAYRYLHTGEARPEVGQLLVVTNWQGTPICIVEITSVTECQYNEVTPEFAAAEGEGDKTLTWWRKMHWDYFSNECAELGVTANEEMLLVLERFKVVYPAPIDVIPG